MARSTKPRLRIRVTHRPIWAIFFMLRMGALLKVWCNVPKSEAYYMLALMWIEELHPRRAKAGATMRTINELLYSHRLTPDGSWEDGNKRLHHLIDCGFVSYVDGFASLTIRGRMKIAEAEKQVLKEYDGTHEVKEYTRTGELYGILNKKV